MTSSRLALVAQRAVDPGPEVGVQDVWDAELIEQAPAILAGPAPAYPELLRQAGLQGRVVLEAVVDTSGRVELGSLTVVSASNPGFVAPARQALSSTLFRPGRVRGHAVRVRVRVPMEFMLRNGTGPAR
jgi:protein TonB